MARIAFLIERKNYYRLLGPLVDRALQDGWKVECWHDYGQSRRGVKSYEFPDIEATPSFVHGRPQYVTYQCARELGQLLGKTAPEIVIALRTPLATLGVGLSNSRTRWVTTMHSWDFFEINGPQGILSSDLSTVYSDYWCTKGIEYFRKKVLTDFDEERLKAKMISVGFPEMDQTSLIAREDVRRRWNIPQDKPVVVLLPYPTGSNPASFWSRKIYSEPSGLKQALNMVMQHRFEYLPNVLGGWSDASVVKAICRFCDRNKAHLIVKSRLKDPIPTYTHQTADLCLYDESYYPATILEALSIADLCIGFYSGAVVEAAYLGVPSLCITFSLEDLLGPDLSKASLGDLMLSRDEGGIFQFQGVSWTMTIPEVIENLPEMSFDDFRMNLISRSRYVEKFLSFDDGQSSERVLCAIRRLLNQGVAK